MDFLYPPIWLSVDQLLSLPLHPHVSHSEPPPLGVWARSNNWDFWHFSLLLTQRHSGESEANARRFKKSAADLVLQSSSRSGFLSK